MLLAINPINQQDPATPTLWNSRFAKIVEVMNGNIDTDNIKNGAVTAEKLAANTLAALYPIGSVYINATNSANPGSLFGFGTWEAFGAGRVPVGIDSTQTEFDTPGKTGGHKELQSHNHTGSTSQSGDHQHSYTAPPNQKILPIHGSGDSNHGFNDGAQGGVTSPSGNHTHSFTTNNAGNGNAGNLQPFVTVYMWRRVA